MKTILVIKLGALGDFVIADAPFDWIRRHHRCPQGQNTRIVLLTTPLFEKFAQQQGYFDEVIALPRFKYYDLKSWGVLFQHLKRLKPMRVYDLQMVNRTKIYAGFMALCRFLRILPAFEWVGHLKHGIACLEQEYFKKHPLERFARLFSKLDTLPLPSLDITRLGVPMTFDPPQRPYVFLVPNASNTFGGAKKWPLLKYKELILWLVQRGYHVVIIGGPGDDHSVLHVDQHSVPYPSQNIGSVMDLTGKTSFENMIDLAKNAALAIGGDTGPMHIAAASRCPVFVLFSKKSNPAELGGPRGPLYHHLSSEDLLTLESSQVIKELEAFLTKL